ncbi:hypothetical protein P4U05_17050 [Bacillus paranthracis]|uniref:hypothetical protein n=1 Tax=Bacillus phage phi4B1 TaxID=1643324 RepID=UPI000200F410|nr:hypothetical protein [Bacillus paranthracis]YP_009206342.1 hypothetical protein XO26_0043 [Bacillus phage phi4B1]ADY20336.1 hypothetical protein YBT020_05450 [Bacillus thuringiensis serovar finitimus YBT-020]MRC72831.1 hypothetical protein [Bacillus thuringiensis]OTX71280.1 hypothetical protein BK722_12770 [Bacillus thuringiensis serovar finitimus]PGZ45723.1 hypothetical protein COE56_25925 [Bacillus anthracis]ALF02573.1 hypothetical protein XO26_0043 [Bacillus phage phi4B1]
MKTIVRDGSVPLGFNRSTKTRYLRDRRLSELLKRCRRLEEEGFDYLFPIRRVLETIRHAKDENPHLFKGCEIYDRDRGFYYEVVMKKVK